MWNFRSLMIQQNNDYPQWVKNALAEGIPLNNIIVAYNKDNNIKKSFNGEGRRLTGNGNGYFDTGYVPTNDTLVKTIFRCDNIQSQTASPYSPLNSWFFGAEYYGNRRPASKPQTRFGIFYNGDAYTINPRIGDTGGYTGYNTKLGQEVYARFGKGAIILDEVEYPNPSTTLDLSQLDLTMFIFGGNSNGDPKGNGSIVKGTMTNYFSIQKGTSTIHYYVPMKLNTGECILYDMIDQKELHDVTGSTTNFSITNGDFLEIIANKYTLPIDNLRSISNDVDNKIIHSFNGKDRWLVNNGKAFINIELTEDVNQYDIEFCYTVLDLDKTNTLFINNNIKIVIYTNGKLYIENNDSKLLLLDNVLRGNIIKCNINYNNGSINVSINGNNLSDTMNLQLSGTLQIFGNAANNGIGSFNRFVVTYNGSKYYLIPVEDQNDNSCYMYDVANNITYKNDGSNEFSLVDYNKDEDSPLV